MKVDLDNIKDMLIMMMNNNNNDDGDDFSCKGGSQ